MIRYTDEKWLLGSRWGSRWRVTAALLGVLAHAVVELAFDDPGRRHFVALVGGWLGRADVVVILHAKFILPLAGDIHVVGDEGGGEALLLALPVGAADDTGRAAGAGPHAAGLGTAGLPLGDVGAGQDVAILAGIGAGVEAAGRVLVARFSLSDQGAGLGEAEEAFLEVARGTSTELALLKLHGDTSGVSPAARSALLPVVDAAWVFAAHIEARGDSVLGTNVVGADHVHHALRVGVAVALLVITRIRSSAAVPVFVGRRAVFDGSFANIER
jgi:hypothetical protein